MISLAIISLQICIIFICILLDYWFSSPVSDQFPFLLLSVITTVISISAIAFLSLASAILHRFRHLTFVYNCINSLVLKRILAGLSGVSLLIILIYIFSPITLNEIQKPKLVILGLDGATWDILDPLIEEGKLPAIASLRSKGASGNLFSLDPMRSPALWTSIATGRTPDAHGVSGFLSTRADLAQPRMWDIAQQNNLSLGLFRWLAMWPIMDEFSFVVPSWLARSNEVWPSRYECLQQVLLRSPAGLRSQLGALAQCVNRGARLSSVERMAKAIVCDPLRRDELTALADRELSSVNLQTDMYIAMLSEIQPDVSAFVLYGSDQLAHRFWQYHQPGAFTQHEIEPNQDYAKVIENYYVLADRAFGRIISQLPDHCRIMLVSDHGMKADPAMPGQFFIDGDAVLNQLDAAGTVKHHFIERRWILESSQPALPTLVKALEAIQFNDGSPVFSVEQDKGTLTVRTNFSMTAHPDSPLNTNKTIIINEKECLTDDFFFVRYFSGAHDLRGVFLMQGPGVEPGAWVEDASLLDIAPTALYWLGLPLSREFDGGVIEPAFQPNYLDSNQRVEVDAYGPLANDETTVPGASSAVMERLRSLGYVE